MTERGGLHPSEFLDRLSHELRSPLFPIIALSDLLMKIDPSITRPEEWRGQIELIHQSGQTLLKLVSDLVELTRIELGRRRVDLGWLTPRSLITRLESSATSGISLEASEDDTRVFSAPNLFTEAAKSLLWHVEYVLRPKRGTAAAVLEEDRLRFVIRAQETELDSALFSRFFEALPTFTRDALAAAPEEVSGLTLALTKATLEDVGGAVEVSSEGRDVQIGFWIPCRKPEPTPDLAAETVCVFGRALRLVFPAAIALQAEGASVLLARSTEELSRSLGGVTTVLSMGEGDSAPEEIEFSGRWVGAHSAAEGLTAIKR